MQKYKKIPITKEEIVPVAERMRKNGVILAMIHGYLTDEGKVNISYEYELGETIESYTIEGENVLPSISAIYDQAAAWPERELNEIFGVEFEGLDMSKRLFLPEEMLETQGKGHIMVTPLAELRAKNIKEEG